MFKIKKGWWFVIGVLGLVGVGLFFMSQEPEGSDEHEAHDQSRKTLSKSQDVKLKKAIKDISRDYQEKVEPIFKVSCFDCHSNATHYPWYHVLPGIRGMLDKDISTARKHIDMSDGYPFKGHGSLVSDLKAIAYQVDKGKMPLFKYRVMHPGSVLTEKQKQEIEDWTGQSIDKLEEAGL
jgi:hypothetical protein